MPHNIKIPPITDCFKTIIIFEIGTVFLEVINIARDVVRLKRAQIKNISELFRLAAGKALLEEDTKGPIIQDIINQSQQIHFAETHDKVVIGIMVQYVKQIKWTIGYRDGWEKVDLFAIAKELNRTPLLTQKFYCAEEELKRVIGNMI